MKKKILIAAVLAFLAVLTLVSCSKDKPAESGDLGDSVMVQIEMQNGGIIKLELYPKAAPIQKSRENSSRTAGTTPFPT